MKVVGSILKTGLEVGLELVPKSLSTLTDRARQRHNRLCALFNARKHACAGSINTRAGEPVQSQPEVELDASKPYPLCWN